MATSASPNFHHFRGHYPLQPKGPSKRKPYKRSQDRKPRRCKTYEHDGRVLSAPQWGELLGWRAHCIRLRLRSLPPDQALIPKADYKAAKANAVSSGMSRPLMGPPPRLWTHNGLSLSCADWAKELGWSIFSLRKRLRNLPVEQALTPKCRQRPGKDD
jgi:hypothetical protein